MIQWKKAFWYWQCMCDLIWMLCEMLHVFRLLSKKTGIDAFKVTLKVGLRIFFDHTNWPTNVSAATTQANAGLYCNF